MTDSKTRVKKKNGIINRSGKKSKPSSHYISNVDFYDAMKAYVLSVKEAKQHGKPKPQLSAYIGQCIIDIATRLAFKPNFANYAFREEMVHDAIENCITYIDNFDPEKSKNPFSYFTQICYYAFLRRIEREKKQVYLKYRAFEKLLSEDPNASTFLKNMRKTTQDHANLTDDELNQLPEFLKLTETDIRKFAVEKKSEK